MYLESFQLLSFNKRLTEWVEILNPMQTLRDSLPLHPKASWAPWSALHCHTLCDAWSKFLMPFHTPNPHKAGTSSVVHWKVWMEKHLRSLEDIHHEIVSGNDRTPKFICFCQEKHHSWDIVIFQQLPIDMALKIHHQPASGKTEGFGASQIYHQSPNRKMAPGSGFDDFFAERH